jgi:glycosyltransferase involved in cell wall biosynthesis
MPVHNAARFLDESVGSVLGQTFTDFELVALENGSSDDSRAILRRYAACDPRVRVIECDRTLGLVDSANAVVEEASTRLIARMDADDLMHPERIERQHAVMSTHPEVVAVGSLSDGVDANGRHVLPRNRWRLLRCAQAPFPHGSAMVRREVFERIGGYRPGLSTRDIDMLLRLRDHGRVLVLPEALYTYRYNPSSNSLAFSTADFARATADLNSAFARRRAGHTGEDPPESSAFGPPPPDAIVAALHAQGALRLWAGGSPGVMRELIELGVRLEPGWLKTFAWAACGQASPGTLRWALRAATRAKDFLAAPRFRDGKAYEWRLAR